MSEDLPKSLERFGAELERAIARDLARADRRAKALAWRRRAGRRRLTPAVAATITAAVATAVVLASTAVPGPAPAYALSLGHGGALTLTIRDLTRAAPELNARFAAMGIEQRVVPIRRGCPERRVVNYPNQRPTQTITFTPTRNDLLPGFVDVLAAARQADGRVSLTLMQTQGPVPRCFGTAVWTPPSSSPVRAPRIVSGQ